MWLPLHRNLPKVERFAVGQKIEHSFLDLLELIFTTAFLPLGEKASTLSKAVAKLDHLKFFLQLAWESKLVPTQSYATLSGNLEEIGRMLGGWKKGLEAKLPPK